MSVAPNSGIIDFSTFFPPSGGQDGIQGQVPKPLAGQENYVLTGSGWASLGSLGVISYQGTWNAATNTPTITSGVGTQGYYYVVSVAGNTTIDGISNWGVGDWIIFNGATWQKIEGGSQGNFSTLDVTGQSSLGTGSANSLTINGAAGGSSPTIQSTGSDANVGLNLTTKGAGTVNISAANITGGTIDGTTIGGTTPAQGNFTNVRINQSWDEGTGRLQVLGQAAIEGNAVAQDVVVQGGNNLLSRSAEFNEAVWIKSQSSVSQNVETAPNGTLTGGKFVVNSGVEGNIYQSFTFSAITYSFSVFAKAAEYSYIFLSRGGFGGVVFNLSSGVITSAGSGYSGTITPVGNGWYRCSIVFTPAAISSNVRIYLSSNGTSFLGDGTSGIYIWGAQLELGTVASPYTPTTSAAVTTTNDIFVPSGQVLPALGTASLPSYSILGDTNTGLFSPAADTLAISTGGSERVRVDSSGRLVIGTTTGRDTITVGAAPGSGVSTATPNAIDLGNTFSNTAAANLKLKLYNDGAVTPTIYGFGVSNSQLEYVVGETVTNRHVFYRGTTELARLTGGGLLGLATSAPTNILSFGGNAARTIWMERHTTADTAGNNLTVQSGGATSGATDKAGGNLLLSSGTATGTGSSVITFLTATAGTTGTADRAPTEKMRIDGAGNVGIGTSSPLTPLHVTGSWPAGAQAGVGFMTGYDSTAGYTNIQCNGTTGTVVDFATSGTDWLGRILYVNSTNTLSFGTNTTTRLQINGSGTVIIGNGETAASPNNALLQATGGEGTNITGATLTIQGGRGTGSASGGPIIFSTAAAGSSGTTLNAASERVRIDADGRIGIGTSSPIGRVNIVDNAGEGLLFDSYGQNPSIFFRRAQGTQSSPTAVQSGNIIGVFGGRGYNGSAFSVASRVSLFFYASENWTTTANGTYITLETTPDGSTTRSERVRVKPAGQMRFVPLAADPAGAEAGDVYYNSGVNKLKNYDGSAWQELVTAADVAQTITFSKLNLMGL